MSINLSKSPAEPTVPLSRLVMALEDRLIHKPAVESSVRLVRS